MKEEHSENFQENLRILCESDDQFPIANPPWSDLGEFDGFYMENKVGVF